MPFMGKTDDGYSELSTIVNSSGTEIDYVLSKTDDGYKRTFTKLRELTGEAPLSFKGITPAPDLTNYRIYGQTVDGESVGDRTGNLFDKETVTPRYGVSKIDGEIFSNPGISVTNYIFVKPNTTYTNTASYYATGRSGIAFYDINKQFLSGVSCGEVTSKNTPYTYTTPSGCYYMRVTLYTGSTDEAIDPDTYQINEGSTPLPYEPYGYKVPVTVEGKNLLPNKATSQTINGVAITVNSDKSISLSFDSVSFTRWVSINSNVSVTTGYILNGCPNLGINGLALRATSNNSSYYVQDTGTGILIDDTIGEYAHIDIRIPSDYANSNLTFYPMIRKADITDDTYEPYQPPVTTSIYLPEPLKMVGDEAEYVDFEKQKQHKVRKNLLPTITATYSRNGLLLTNESDGTVSINGTATTTAYPNLMENISYPFDTILSGCPQGGSLNGYCLRANSSPSSNVSIDFGNGALIPANTNVYIEIRIQVGFECNNLKFTPMIRKADIEDDTYEPYIENTDLDVTLPALPTLAGTNTMSVGTEVQPSSVYLKGAIKALPSGGDT